MPSITYHGIPGRVKAVAVSPDGSVVYAGGKFDAVNGQPVKNLVAVSASDGHLVAGFRAPSVNQVNTILAAGRADLWPRRRSDQTADLADQDLLGSRIQVAREPRVRPVGPRIAGPWPRPEQP